MSIATLPLPQYGFMAWCLVKALGLYLYLYLRGMKWQVAGEYYIMSFINCTFNDILLG
jgi:hypothetical protein